MNSKDERDPRPTTRPPESTEPRKRFRIEKLEERIAPTKGGKGTHHCSTSSITISSGGSIY